VTGWHRFAAYNGSTPVAVSCGDRKIHRLSLRGNRRLTHVIHMAAVTQIRYQHSPSRAYFDRKIDKEPGWLVMTVSTRVGAGPLSATSSYVGPCLADIGDNGAVRLPASLAVGAPIGDGYEVIAVIPHASREHCWAVAACRDDGTYATWKAQVENEAAVPILLNPSYHVAVADALATMLQLARS
jgi:hypothetical protein